MTSSVSSLIDPLLHPTHRRDDSSGSETSTSSSGSSYGATDEIEVFQGEGFSIAIGRSGCFACDKLFKRDDYLSPHFSAHHEPTIFHDRCIRILSSRGLGCLDETCRNQLTTERSHHIPAAAGERRVEIRENPFEITGQMTEGGYTLTVHESVCCFCQEVFRRDEIFRVHQCSGGLIAFHDSCLTVLTNLGFNTDGVCMKDLSTEQLRRTPNLEETRAEDAEVAERVRKVDREVCVARMVSVCIVLFGGTIIGSIFALSS